MIGAGVVPGFLKEGGGWLADTNWPPKYIFICLNWTSFAPKKLTKDELESVTVKSLTMPQKRKKISTKTDAVILSTLTLFQISNFYEWLI